MCTETSENFVKDSRHSASNNVPNRMATGDIVQIIVACLGIFLVLVYPLCFLTLMTQIGTTYHYDYVMARYAASLAPTSVVAAKIIFISIYSSLAGLVMVLIYMALKPSKSRWRYLTPAAVTTLGLVPMLGPIGFPTLPNLVDLRMHRLFNDNVMYVIFTDTFLYMTCLIAVVLGAVVSVNVCSRAGENQYSILPWKASFWEDTQHAVGVGIVYLGALIAGVCFSAVHGPNLPEVQLYLKGEDPNNPRKAYMLSVSDETWYVIDSNKPFLLAIPADGVEGMESTDPTHDPVLPLKATSQQDSR